MFNLNNKTAIITSQFPESNETFVIRELAALSTAGFKIEIFSLKKCRDRIRHPEAEVLAKQTTVIAWDDPGVWLRSAAAFLRHPVKSSRALAWVLRHESSSVTNLAKAIVVWMQSLVLARQMKAKGITHVHSHWATMPTTAAVLTARLLNLRFSFTAHAWDIFVSNPSLPEKVRLASAIITCTESNRQALADMCPTETGKIRLSYHGVDIRKFDSTNTGIRNNSSAIPVSTDEKSLHNDIKPMFLSVGRFVEQKGYEDLVSAYEEVKNRGVSFNAVIVGEGPLRKSIQRRIESAGLTDYVEIKSDMPQSELADLYRHAYAFVLPCVISANGDRDGIPNVILEAMAAGLPVISTTVSGVPEAVRDQISGFTVNPHSPAQLASALESIAADRELGARMGCESRHIAVERFSDELHLAGLVVLMNEIISYLS